MTPRDSRLDYAYGMTYGAGKGAGRICYSRGDGGGTGEEGNLI